MPVSVESFVKKWQTVQEEILPTMSLGDFTAVTTNKNNSYTAEYHGMTLKTALQPIFSVDHQRTIGYEALVRANNNAGEVFSPLALLSYPTTEFDSIYLDRLCRYIHTANFQKFSNSQNWLFINVSAQASVRGREYGAFFAELLNEFKISPNNVVVEIIEDPTTDNKQLIASVNYYKNMGCLVAIDDFGAGHSNFERVWNLKPDIVKLDRSLLVQAVNSKRTHNMLNSIVDLLHQAGCLVVIEGVEDEEQALIAIKSGADFIQGFYFARPQINLIRAIDKKDLFTQLSDKFIAFEQVKTEEENKSLAKYRQAFRETILNLQQGIPLTQACQPINGLKRSLRCFLLDEVGNQIDSTLSLSSESNVVSSKFKQLQISENANWYRKHYVAGALEHHSRIFTSKPYRSITGDGLCITFSIAFRKAGKTHIFCYDIETIKGY